MITHAVAVGMVVKSTVADSVPEPTKSVKVSVTVAADPRKHSHAEDTCDASIERITAGADRTGFGVVACLCSKSLRAGVALATPSWGPYDVPV